MAELWSQDPNSSPADQSKRNKNRRFAHTQNGRQAIAYTVNRKRESP